MKPEIHPLFQHVQKLLSVDVEFDSMWKEGRKADKIVINYIQKNNRPGCLGNLWYDIAC